MNVLTVVVVSDTMSRQMDCLCEFCNVCIPVCWSVGVSSTMRPWERAFASCSFSFLTSACSCLTLPWVSSFTIAYRDTNTQVSLLISSRILRRSWMFGWIILLFNLIFDEFGSLSELQSGKRLSKAPGTRMNVSDDVRLSISAQRVLTIWTAVSHDSLICIHSE